MLTKLAAPLLVKIVLALGLALVASNAAWGVWSMVQSERLTTAGTKLKAADTARDTALANVRTANTQHDITRGSLEDALAELAACQTARDAIRDANRKAVATVQADLQDANATLAELSARYQRAMRDPECLICAGRPICPALMEGQR